MFLKKENVWILIDTYYNKNSNSYLLYQNIHSMIKNIQSLLYIVISLILITACDSYSGYKDSFVMGDIPGKYLTKTTVYYTNGTDVISTREIPECNSSINDTIEYHNVEIWQVNGRKFKLAFEPTDRILPAELEIEVDTIYNPGSNDFRAKIKNAANDSFEILYLYDYNSFSMENMFHFQDFYFANTILTFHLTIKSKTQNFYLESSGWKFIN